MRALFDCSLRSLCLFARSARGDVRSVPPSSSELTEPKALFRHLLLQIGGANIENPPRDSRRSQLGPLGPTMVTCR